MYSRFAGSSEEKKRDSLGVNDAFTVREDDNISSNFYQRQLQDRMGKEEIDEKLVAKVTNAKEVLKKSRHRFGNIFDDGGEGIQHLQLLDLLTMFREN